MKSLQALNSIPAWQREHAEKLHHICQLLKAATVRGEPISKAIRRTVARLNGTPFKCDPRRRLALSPATLRRVWDKWCKGGEVPAAVAMRFHLRRSTISPQVLARFAAYCASQHLPSLKAAWLKFSARGGSFGSGRRAFKPLKISYGQLAYNFRASDFQILQGHLRAIQAAETAKSQHLFKVGAEIRQRAALYPRRQRVKRAINFEI